MVSFVIGILVCSLSFHCVPTLLQLVPTTGFGAKLRAKLAAVVAADSSATPQSPAPKAGVPLTAEGSDMVRL